MVRSRFVMWAVLVALVAGACGSEPPAAPPATPAAPASAAPVATPAPTPTPAPAATATPAPSAAASPEPSASADAAAAFKAVMGDPLFAANVTLSGTMALGTDVTASTGTLDILGPTSHLVQTTTRGTRTSGTEVIHKGGLRYSTTGGKWFSDGASLGDDLVKVLESIDGTVTDLGVETVSSGRLHHLTIDPPAALAAALGVAAKGVGAFAGTVDAWVDDAGAPVIVRLAAAWDQRSGKKTVPGTAAMDLRFDNVGGSVEILAPTELWTWATSKKYGYRMAYPTDWQFEPARKTFIDGFWGYNGNAVFGERFKSYGYSLNQVVSIITKDSSRLTGAIKAKVTSNKPGKLGRLPARIVSYAGTYKHHKYWWVTYVAVKGPWVYWIELRTTAKTTAQDRALAADFAATHSPR